MVMSKYVLRRDSQEFGELINALEEVKAGTAFIGFFNIYEQRVYLGALPPSSSTLELIEFERKSTGLDSNWVSFHVSSNPRIAECMGNSLHMKITENISSVLQLLESSVTIFDSLKQPVNENLVPVNAISPLGNVAIPVVIRTQADVRELERDMYTHEDELTPPNPHVLQERDLAEKRKALLLSNLPSSLNKQLAELEKAIEATELTRLAYPQDHWEAFKDRHAFVENILNPNSLEARKMTEELLATLNRNLNQFGFSLKVNNPSPNSINREHYRLYLPRYLPTFFPSSPMPMDTNLELIKKILKDEGIGMDKMFSKNNESFLCIETTILTREKMISLNETLSSMNAPSSEIVRLFIAE